MYFIRYKTPGIGDGGGVGPSVEYGAGGGDIGHGGNGIGNGGEYGPPGQEYGSPAY